MYVAESGNPDGESILWLHGSLVAGWMWAEQIARLPDFHHLVPDLPGIGQSGDERWQSLDDTAARLVELIRERASGGRSHVVGLSLGAVVGLRMMSRTPELVERAVLSGTLTRPFPNAMARLQQILLWLYHSRWGSRLVAGSLRLPSDVQQVFVQTAQQTPSTTYRTMMPELSTTPLPPRIGHIDVPTLVVTGERDTPLTKHGVPDLVAALPNAQGYWAEKVGHQWNAENGALFAAMVDAWLNEKELPAGLIPVTKHD